MNWDDLKIVLALSRTGSLTRAAEALGIDQSTAGRRLTALEAALGVVLFARSRTGFAPTEAGEAAIRRALEMEQRALRLADDLARGGEPAGVVLVAGGPWTIMRVAAVAAPRLAARHPGIELTLNAGRPAPTTLLGEASLSLWFEAPPREGEFAVKLGDAPYAVYGPAGVEAARLPWLAHRNDPGPGRAHDRWMRGVLGPDEKPALRATDSLLLSAAARAGVGRALLPMCLGAADPGLVRLDDGPPALTRPLHLHVHPDTVQLRRVQAVIELLRAEFAVIFGAGAEADAPTPDSL
jgi:DNA-binding transcriptional LysR family regulator